MRDRFSALRAQGRRALIPYITAGDPSREAMIGLMHQLAAAGADVIELGVPFSDPMADGPVIQRSSERALARGVSLQDCIDWVAKFRQKDWDTPVVLMGYANPIERFGSEAFTQAAAQAGVDGVLVVDYPPEECESFSQMLRAAGIDPIFLLAPTSSEKRIAQVARLGSGYLYYVSLKGVTGAGHLNTSDVQARVAQIRGFTDMPVGVGFGISDAQTAVAVGNHADAVVIGSALIRLMENSAQASQDPVVAASGFIQEVRQALDNQCHPLTGAA
ncbi:MAG: tryptophan synthase subunit alpha [Burkholderiaceae bacterium]